MKKTKGKGNRLKMVPSELQAYMDFRRRGKRHEDRRKPKGGGRSYLSPSWEE